MIETDALHQPFEVGDLDRAGVLELFDDAEQLDRVAQRRKLRLACRWARVNPAAAEIDAATWGAARRGSAHDCEDPIGGPGSPLVAAAAVTTLGARLGISLAAAQALIADALDLAHRLPGIHGRVEALELPAWKARRVAALTRSLSVAAAAWVDDQLAGRIDRVGLVTIERVVAAAVAAFHPDRLETDPKTARSHWRVDLSHPLGARDNSHLEATADTLDLVGFHDLVCAVAEALRVGGDDDTLDQRKAKALGVIGRGEHHDLLTHASATQHHPDATDATEDQSAEDQSAEADSAEDETGAEPSPRRWQRRRPGAPTKIYLHLNADDLHPDPDPGSSDPGQVRVGHLERLGPVTLDRIREWAGHPGVRIQPVLRTDATAAVDGHDPPAWMAEVVRLRDPHCVFPGCQRDSRTCDLDHIDPYRPHGPPGQTHPGNLAPLCRRHHNAKTHHGWRYHRLPDGTYLWTDPDHAQYLVTITSSIIIPTS